MILDLMKNRYQSLQIEPKPDRVRVEVYGISKPFGLVIGRQTISRHHWHPFGSRSLRDNHQRAPEAISLFVARWTFLGWSWPEWQ